MRVWIAAVVGIGACLAVASANADETYRTDTGPIADFSGVGVGIDFGAGFGSSASVNTSGVAGGVHAGYNLQSGPIVGGAEADILFGSISGGDAYYASFSENAMGSVRAKAGYAFGPILAYGTIGWAYSDSSLRSFGYSSSQSLTGVVYGIGAEYALTRTVSMRAELRRYDFGGVTYYFPTSAQQVSTSTNMLLMGLTTHF